MRVPMLMLAAVLAPMGALADDAGAIDLYSESAPATDWLPGDRGTGTTAVRIHRGPKVEPVPEVAEDLAWSPNRPVSVANIPTRAERNAARRELEERRRAARRAEREYYYYYPAYYLHRERPKYRFHLRIGDRAKAGYGHRVYKHRDEPRVFRRNR